ncbi:hypothetical protein GCM10020358_63500 [Amorphoplanes nipponensis]|uniref:Uncharacterized protein n=1 Tax=Actinoplanes nipponensis TaxID=135950 RepID=A0A919JN36_9ACTN|nr:hypothetical protein [Actinoplanes nipponensis]GIE52245.1 hypothetical protein Ani05nite_57790 [Actinoplanes nipponensis]
MRHLRSILYALVLAPAVWILCGVGFDQDLTGRARDNGGIESLSGVLLLVLAGAAYAILLFSPISPLGPLLAGLAFLGVGAWARLAPSSYAGVWPGNVASDGFDLSTPGYGLAVLLAVPLVATALSARRWRGFEPPEILFVGTIGRARGAAAVAGTPMASERTAVIPQQRPGSGPGFGGSAAEATQVVGPGRPMGPAGDATQVVGLGRPAGPAGSAGSAGSAEEATQVVGPGRPMAATEDDDEKTTVMRLGRQPGAEEPTEVVPAAAEEATEDVAASEDATATLSGLDDPTRDMAADETTRDVAADETTRDVVEPGAIRPGRPGSTPGEETTQDVTGSDVTAAFPDDGDERTQLLALPRADGRSAAAADRGEQTQVIRAGTVEPPGDRTQLLSFPAPAEAVTVATPVTDPGEQTSIVAAERPDPGDDPTTLLTPPAPPPAGATTRANPDRSVTTVSSLERPADEAADDTRPLTLPAPRPPAQDDATHR